MGKGNRARIERAQNKLDRPQYVAEKKQTPKWAGTAIVVFIVVILALSLTLNALYDSGAMMRSSSAMKSENYTVSGTMLSYFYNSQYMSFMNTYGSIVSYLGIDTNTSLKTQACSMLSDGGTWFDYFMNTTTSYVSELLLCCEYAKANGIELDDEDKQIFLDDLGIAESGLDRLIKASYSLLGLISYLTAGPQEVRAWTITKGTKAPQAAGKIHSDFERGFIRAEIVSFDDLERLGSMAAVKDAGLYRSEGKEYVMRDGDVVLFRFNV